MGRDLQGQAVWDRVSVSLWAVAHVRWRGGRGEGRQVKGHGLGGGREGPFLLEPSGADSALAATQKLPPPT